MLMVDSRPEKQKMMLPDQGQMRFQFQHTPMLMTFQKSDTESLTTFLTGEQSPAALKARINQLLGRWVRQRLLCY